MAPGHGAAHNYVEEGAMNLSELNKIATAMVAPGHGILAAD